MVSKSEISLLSDLFACSTWQWSAESIEQFTPAPKTIDTTERIYDALQNQFASVPTDSLKKPLSILIENAATRYEHKFSIPSPNERLVKYDNMDSFLLFTEVIYDTPALQDICFLSTDYTRITMLLLGYFDRVILQRKCRAGLVVNAGVEQAYYSGYRLEKLAPKIKIIDIVTEGDIPPNSSRELAAWYDRFDFLITFEPIMSDFLSINISEAIDEHDISRLIASLPSRKADHQVKQLSPLECQPESIKFNSAAEMFCLIYEDFTASGAFTIPFEKFKLLFESQTLFMGGCLVVPIFCESILKTTAKIYSVKKNFFLNGRRLSSIAVLLIEEDDRDSITSITEQFKLLLNQHVNLTDSISEFFSE